ncbi:MAG: response regulator [Myxococcota bacterium]
MVERPIILCVDDDPAILRVLRRSLQRRLGRRCAIETANNGAEALAFIKRMNQQKTPPALVISDAVMPLMDGYALVQWLYDHMPAVHTILITGFGDENKIDRLRTHAGLMAALTKPWKSDYLCSLIEGALALPPA